VTGKVCLDFEAFFLDLFIVRLSNKLKEFCMIRQTLLCNSYGLSQDPRTQLKNIFTNVQCE